MAFSFGGGAASNGGDTVQLGSKLQDITTENLGFLGIAGDVKLRLLPTPWPSDNLPPPTSSLFSTASRKGLVAAAGPDVIIVATLDSVREAFEAPSADKAFKPFQPQLTLPMPMRVSQLAFSADESYLVISAEDGGGLAVYEVQALLNNSTQTAFELATNGTALRALVPNPTPEKGELFAAVTTDGKLMIANLKERAFVNGPNGQVLKDGVSCLSWSTKGKQLVAGLADGTAYQMTPEGEGKAQVPRPPEMSATNHVSSITWLENNVFLMVYTAGQTIEEIPPTVFYLVTRQPPSGFVFQEVPDPVGPWGLPRSPTHHFVLRLRAFPPNLDDMLLVASSTSTDIGILTRSKAPLKPGAPTGVFTLTELSDDSRRAQLPWNNSDSSPIGIGLDLSCKSKVQKPIPRDEIAESSTPLPGLMVLNNEGVLASWWIVYADSIVQGTTYPGLVVADEASKAMSTSAQTSAPDTAAAKPAIAPAAFGASSNSTSGGFGVGTGLGNRASPWGTSSGMTGGTKPAASTGAFGGSSFPTSSAPAFGATSTPAFGSSGFSSAKPSPWASTTGQSAFGQSSGLGKPAGAFGSATPGSVAPSSGGFASFASKPGFAGVAAAAASNQSIFSAKNVSSTPAPSNSVFGGPSGGFGGAFGGASGNVTSQPSTSPFGGASTFSLGTTFKPSEPADLGGPVRPQESSSSMFGNNFATALGETGKSLPETPISKETDMDLAEDEQIPKELAKPTPTTSTPAPSIPSLFGPAATTQKSLFGTGVAQPSTQNASSVGFDFAPKAAGGAKTGGFSFANLTDPPASETTPSADSATPKVKKEPLSDTEDEPSAQNIPEPPLPPDPTSKSTYAAGDTSSSSVGTDAAPPSETASQPQVIKPPQPVTTTSPPASVTASKEVQAGPEDDGGSSDFASEEEDAEASRNHSDAEDESGEEFTQIEKPTSETNQTPGFTPQSSFGGNENPFAANHKVHPPKSLKPLFGEVGGSAPVLVPPRPQASPRSPSPVRSHLPPRLRPEASRSFSAPGVASEILERRKGTTQKKATPSFQLSEQERKSEEERRAIIRARKEAEEAQALIDEEDERTQAELNSEIQPSKRLNEFVAYVEPNSMPSTDSIPDQVQAVYRDINSMIDTIGLNLRSLNAFVKAHTEQHKAGGRTREDLEQLEEFEDEDDEWCLVEMDDLSTVIETSLLQELETCRVKDSVDKLGACNELQKEFTRCHSRQEDINKILAARSDAEQLEAARFRPLSGEQIAQQQDLRREFTKVQRLLSEAEEGLTMLKTKLVSQTTSSGRLGSSGGPTVEAVMRTITKMTTMAEKRSGDIDVLEGQMRKLRLGSVAGGVEDTSFATPRKNQRSLRSPAPSSSFRLSYTPNNKDDIRGFQDSLRSSTNSIGRGSPPRKKISGYSAEEKSHLKAQLARKNQVKDQLKASLRKVGPRLRELDDEY